ncbi:MAG: fumarylacetoacetate hydrolase family protein [Gammaproteobacteria bacterium]
MKICRYAYEGSNHTGIIEDETIREIQGNVLGDMHPTGQVHPLADAELLPPSSPTKMIGIGVNYKVHAKYGYAIPEEPLMFQKAVSALTGHNGNIIYPAATKQLDYEGELAVVIGRETRHVSPADAPAHILGYTCANDVTARDIQAREHNNYGHSKCFDTFAPMGPWIETDLDPSNLLLETFLNGQKKQSCSTSDMAFSINEIVAFVSDVMTLLPGDIISTGTPDGMGTMSVGDVVEVTIEGIGTLRNTVVAPAERP